jgi:hypothetical protein
MSLESRRNTLAITVGWWLLRRKLRKRADTAITGLLAGTGISGAAPKRRHPLRSVILAAMLAGGAFLAWKRLRGGRNDDGGTWTPDPPSPPPAPPMERAPVPEPDPVAA